jgi:hypothetical protein
MILLFMLSLCLVPTNGGVVRKKAFVLLIINNTCQLNHNICHVVFGNPISHIYHTLSKLQDLSHTLSKLQDLSHKDLQILHHTYT